MDLFDIHNRLASCFRVVRLPLRIEWSEASGRRAAGVRERGELHRSDEARTTLRERVRHLHAQAHPPDASQPVAHRIDP